MTKKLGGRKRPQSQHTYAPRLENYLRASIATPPGSTSYRTTPDPALTEMFKNDSLGDCVVAARAHRLGQLTALSGAPFVYTDKQILAEYSRVGGYVVGDDSTDQGCDMTVNNIDGVSHGYADGSKDLGWLTIDGTNRAQVEQAVYLFEGSVDLGIELPDEWVNPFPEGNGFIWDVAGAPNPNNGHCVQVIDYDTRGVIIATWGLWGWITWAAMSKYLSKAAYGECYLHLSPDMLTKAQTRAPNGVAWADLIADFDSMGGHVPAPAPAPVPAPPAPVPVPVPVPPAPAPVPPPAPHVVTLAQARGWIDVALGHGPHVMTRAQAEKIAADALTKNWPKV